MTTGFHTIQFHNNASGHAEVGGGITITTGESS